MIQIVALTLLLVAMAFAWKKSSTRQRRWLAGFVLALGFLFLAFTGRLAWAFAVLAGAIPWLMRVLQLHAIWKNLRTFGLSSSRTGTSDRTSSAKMSMTREEAYRLLDLPQGAPAEQIKQAHRRLMQTVHPDKGGSAYLAAKLNEARDILLNS